VLAVLTDLGEGGERELAERVGFPRRLLGSALRRLVTLDYVAKAMVDDRTVYRLRRTE